MLENTLNQIKKTLPYYVSVDAGSTGTRSGSGQEPGVLVNRVEVSSEFGEYFETPKKIVPPSKAIEDNLMLRLKSDTLPNGTYLFGSLVQQEDCIRMSLNDNSKCLSKVTHINTLATVAHNLLGYDQDQEDFTVRLIVALRPTDMDNISNVQTFKDKLIGTHSVEYPLLTRKLNITIEDVDAIAEPTAAIIKVLSSPEGKGIKKALLLDGGGTSIDSVMSKGATIVASKSSSSIKGGEDIKEKYASIVGQHIGYPPTAEQLNMALVDAKIDGSKSVDLTDLNALFHKQVFSIAEKEMNKCLQKNEETLHSINAVILIGKLFTPVEGRLTANSLMQDKCQAIPGLRLVTPADPYVIVDGASLYQKLLYNK